MGYILALDQGTTSSRAVLFDHDGNVLGMAQKEFPQIFPSPGWVEHDAGQIWSSQAGVVTEVLAQCGIPPKEVRAIGITNQRETTVVWDRKTGKPIHNAIVWQDRRTTDICETLKKGGAEAMVRERTGLLLDPYFSGTKIHWILKNIKGAREKAERGELAFGTIDSWLVWKLTGGRVHVTDVTNASRTLLMNLKSLDWDEEMLKLLEIPRSMLPEIRSSSEPYGSCDPALFGSTIPISGMAGDQQAALIGQSCFQKGMAKNTYGTGCFLLMNVGGEIVHSRNNLITTVAYQIGKELAYALEGSVFIAGAAVQWLRDQMKLIRSASEVEALAGGVSSSDGVFFVPAFTGLGAPYWDPYARGAIVGMTRGTSAAHLARATLEGIAFQATDVLEAMENDSGVSLKELRVDGGACKNNLLMQMQADLLGVPVLRPMVIESTALGAAFLAGLGVGFWKNLSELASHWQLEKSFSPLLPQEVRTAQRKRWHKAIACVRGWEGE